MLLLTENVLFSTIMTISNRIDGDYKSLKYYFHNLFELLQKAVDEERSFPLEAQDVESLESQRTFHNISHFIKPDMLINIYGFLDFWLKRICESHQRREKLNLRYLDIKGKNDLHAYHKYLTQYVGLDLSAVNKEYNKLQDLRTIRNTFVHNGGHFSSDEAAKKIAHVTHISSSSGSLYIEDAYIWDSIDCAKNYLCAAANEN